MLMKFPSSMRPLSYISVIKFKFKIAEPFLGPLIFLLILDVVQAFPGAPTFSGSINLALGYTSDEGNSHKIVMVRYDDDRIYPISQENLKRHLKQCRPYDINYFPPEKLRIIRIIKISQYEMAILSDFCVSHESKMSFHIIQDVTSSQLTGGIVPGTKWCGKGNIASFPEDLGVFSHLDKCCCDHDNCPDIIRAKEARYGLRNTADYTLLSCDCDEKFRECLANVKKTNATLMERMITRIVGITFFDCFGATCFKEEYPIKCCKHRKPLFSSKCSEYKFDRTRAKFHQLLDPKDYIGGDIVHIVNTGCEKMVPLTPWDKQVPTKSNVPDCDKSDMVDDETNQGYDEEDEQAEKIYLEDLKPSNNFHTISHVDLEFIKPSYTESHCYKFSECWWKWTISSDDQRDQYNQHCQYYQYTKYTNFSQCIHKLDEYSYL